jgi:ParB family chromosome partitioning protein
MGNRRSLKDAIRSDAELSGFVFGENLTRQISSDGTELRVPLSAIHRTSLQKRRYFDLPQIEEWAKTEIAVNGIRSPLWVRPLPGGNAGEYELIAGERRYRAAEYLALKDVPVKVFLLDDKQSLMASLVENMQRQDLNPLDETEGTLEVLAMELDASVEQAVAWLYQMNNAAKGLVNQNVLVSPESQKIQRVFQYLGRISWKSFVSSRLPLLKKPPEILAACRAGKIEYTKAMEIARLADEQQRQMLLERAIAESLSLTEIKEQIKFLAPSQGSKQVDEKESLARRVDDAFKRFKKAKIWHNPKKQRQVEKILNQLEALLED